MILSGNDRDLLSGAPRPAPGTAMSIINGRAEIQGARELLDIPQAHVDSTIDMGEAGLKLVERLRGSSVARARRSPCRRRSCVSPPDGTR
jgi:predicted aconitase